MLTKELKKIGLSEKEAKVYLSLLKIGKSVIQDIAKQANVNRVTTYNIVDSLSKKGLISTFTQGKKAYYTAESPDRLMRLLELKELDLDETERQFKEYLPELKSIYINSENKPRLKFYEGREGIRSIYEEYFKGKNKMLYKISNIDKRNSTSIDFTNEFRPIRLKKRIKLKLIYITKNGPIEELKTSKKNLLESISVDYNRFAFDSDITIFDNKVALTSFKKSNIFVVLIENKEIAQSIRAIFFHLWKRL
ncbi:MAG: hypothetical protein GF347_05615 [Candidatus Moranbacteria bacterium]|nr:hypothetical protein [Candidatus Moranbacteria bacterium]